MEANKIIRICCKEYGISDINPENRKRRYVYPRQVAMYLIYISNPDMSLEEIGLLFGKTVGLVYSSVNTIQGFIDTNPIIRGEIDRLIISNKIKNRKMDRMFIKKV